MFKARTITFFFAAGAAFAAGASLKAETTSVTNGGNSATITQSGDPSKTQKHIERRPGHTEIFQRNGSNSSVIIQDNTPGAKTDPLDNGAEDGGEDATPRSSQNPPGDATADGSAKRPLADAEFYNRVRKQASPQSQQTMDRLMDAMGLQKKM